MKDFSIIAKPLYDLTKKDRKFAFDEVELKSFELLKRKLMESPVVAPCNPKNETELHCDGSSSGFGAVLLQDNGKFHPVFNFSKRTTDAESRYHSFELLTLAIIYALRRFRIYLQLNQRTASWALYLQNYYFVLEYRARGRMQTVEALSRSTNVVVVESNTFEKNLVICQNRDQKFKDLRELLQERKHAL